MIGDPNMARPESPDHPPSVISARPADARRGELTSEGRLLIALLLAFVFVAVLAALDLALDLRHGTTITHVVAEGGVFLVGMFGASSMARRLQDALRRERAARDEALALEQRLRETEAEAARWRDETRELLAGLGTALDRQFERWALSPAEKEVALLLLKGLSHKELAEVRSITEATARQQARAVYKKAGLSGRNDLAAFFLEDLLLPTTAERSKTKT
ncbi:MAG TPA: LuxR C-terminal-related transcriptional regulator [Polyangiaceae bacterium]|nr:LuxR C-terminal-related transcriptional regulator [Polyangiaceae bacterium]